MASLEALEEFVKGDAPKLEPQNLNITVEVPGLAELIEKLSKMRNAAGYTPLAG